MAISKAPNCEMFDSIVCCQSGFIGSKFGWLAICSDMTEEQLGKDMQSGITLPPAPVLIFASEASTMIWAYFSRHGDSCPSFIECINVDCSGVDMDFITLWYQSHCLHQQCGSAFVFHHCVHMSGWLLARILSVYWRCFGIWNPSDQFCHKIGIWSH